MTPSSLLTKLKMRLGIYTTPLPFENPDEALMDVIREITIPTYSALLPYKVEDTIDFTKWDAIERRNNEIEYYMPEQYLKHKLLHINPMESMTDIWDPGQYSDATMLTLGSNLYEDMIQAKASVDLVSMIMPMSSIIYKRPNIVTIRNLQSIANRMRCELCYEHPHNLSTITDNIEDSFVELALCDVANFLYQNLRGYTTIETPIGSYQLPLDDWRSKGEERTELLTSYTETAHYAYEPFYVQ